MIGLSDGFTFEYDGGAGIPDGRAPPRARDRRLRVLCGRIDAAIQRKMYRDVRAPNSAR